MKEDTLPNPVSGNVLANDTDVDSMTRTPYGGDRRDRQWTTITVVGTYGTLVVTMATAPTPTRSPTAGQRQALAEGQHVTDVFSYTDSDNHGG